MIRFKTVWACFEQDVSHVLKTGGLTVCAVGFFGGEVLAQETKPLWEFGMGGAVMTAPDYRGADTTRIWLLPYPILLYRGDFLRADEQSLRGVLFENDRFDLNVSFDAAPPSYNNDDGWRSGMSDLDPLFEVGPKAILKVRLAVSSKPRRGRRGQRLGRL